MKTYSGESVGIGHPDKVCDQVSDLVLDIVREKDKRAKLAIECFLTPGELVIGGEMSADYTVDLFAIRERVHAYLHSIGLSSTAAGFNAFVDAVQVNITPQSSEIRNAVFTDDKLTGAGDQGIVYGYACDETKELMPLVAKVSHDVTWLLNTLRNTISWLHPDCKALVTIEQRGTQQRIKSILASVHHSADIDVKQVRDVIASQIYTVIGDNFDVIVNPAGAWTVGCAAADTGLTGRKIIVDTYCGAARHGGGAFSGKDPSKVDRSGAYYARWVSKHVVSAGLAKRCEIQVGYGISLSEPFNVTIDTHGTGYIPDHIIAKRVNDLFDFTPGNITEQLGLYDFVGYVDTACYGHFGRREFPWEQVDAELLSELESARYYRWII